MEACKLSSIFVPSCVQPIKLQGGKPTSKRKNSSKHAPFYCSCSVHLHYLKVSMPLMYLLQKADTIFPFYKTDACLQSWKYLQHCRSLFAFVIHLFLRTLLTTLSILVCIFHPPIPAYILVVLCTVQTYMCASAKRVPNLLYSHCFNLNKGHNTSAPHEYVSAPICSYLILSAPHKCISRFLLS